MCMFHPSVETCEEWYPYISVGRSGAESASGGTFFQAGQFFPAKPTAVVTNAHASSTIERGTRTYFAARNSDSSLQQAGFLVSES